MALMATIPNGPFAVSIPGESGSRHGCPILNIAPPRTGGIVVLYARKSNGRYEATAVQYQGRVFEFAEFVPFARRWVEENMGTLNPIPGRYACLAPGLDEWSVILRDNGYLGWEATGMPSDVTPDLRKRRNARNSSGILARIPVSVGDRWQHEEILPVFTLVEVMHDSNSSTTSEWISFAEYQRIRAERARLPEAMLADFYEWLRMLTEESGFKCWIFRPGMLFGDLGEWWGDKCRRRTVHEGLDFATGLLPGGAICNVPEGIRVRSLAAGEVVAILDDFIGKTVVIRHAAVGRPEGEAFHTLLSHIQPQVGRLDRVSKGQTVGVIAKSTNTSAPPHLHLAGAWIPKTLPADEIQLAHFHPAFEPVALVNLNDQLQASPFYSLEISQVEPAE